MIGTDSHEYSNGGSNSEDYSSICRLYTITTYGTVNLSDCESYHPANIYAMHLELRYPYWAADNGGTTFRKITGFSRTVGNGLIMYWDVYKVKSETTYTQGSYIEEVTSTVSSSYPQNGVNGTYWYIYKKSEISSYYKGTTYYGNVTSSSSSAYPSNGRHTDGYWYVRI